ncbi:sigma-70 family RNA polymerase sigma factor [Halosquirtibacter xylanolyticus]|uniref:RNA polymerase sigma factor n=1 Tax=Halosquirtibacter xylanolyticus TaxID=3374599 RepID=UPI003747E199|nr:sigma-70 family RNA polymerase sigma factor [Prolixibacteraceae bacterium]
MEQRLWNLIRQNDKEALKSLFDQQYDTLLSYGIRLNFSPSEVEDVIQDLFISLHDRNKSLPKEVNVQAYLFSAIRFSLFNHRKKTRRFSSLSDQDDAIFLLEFDDIDADMSMENVQKKLTQLPTRQKEAIYLKYYQNMSINEIGSIMSIAPQSVSNLLHKAYVLLRNDLSKQTILQFIWKLQS